MNMPHSIQIIATVLFAVAIVHTFSVPVFARLAHKKGPHAGLWHFLAEVEAVFGMWAFVLIVVMALIAGVPTMVNYVDTTNFTEPLFVFAIMVVAASRPVLDASRLLVEGLARLMPVNTTPARSPQARLLLTLSSAIDKTCRTDGSVSASSCKRSINRARASGEPASDRNRAPSMRRAGSAAASNVLPSPVRAID